MEDLEMFGGMEEKEGYPAKGVVRAIIQSEENKYARERRMGMYQQYVVGVEKEVSGKALKELGVAFIEENEITGSDKGMLYHRLVAAVYNMIGDKYKAAAHEISGIQLVGRDKIANLWTLTRESIGAEEWRSQSGNQGSFEEKLTRSERALIADVRLNKIGAHNLED